MWRNFCFALALLLCICRAAAEERSVSKVLPTVRAGLAVKLDELQLEIANIFAPTGQKAVQLNSLINATFECIAKSLSNTTQKPEPAETTPSSTILCGAEHECVGKTQCRNVTSRKNECPYGQVCCQVSNKINANVDDVATCGMRLLDASHGQFGKYPWMMALMLQNGTGLSYIGGASLITNGIVLTAAHKVANLNASQLVVRGGEYDRASLEEAIPHVDRAVHKVILHSMYSSIKDFNIALLVLDWPFGKSPHISPICLPSPSETFDHAQCTVTGWGKTSENSSEYQQVLKDFTVPIVPHAECQHKLQSVLSPSFKLPQNQICAGGAKGVDACLGDGGSPLVCPIKGSSNRYYQAGIVSLGYGCGRENVPAVYTNVARLMPWVSRELNRLETESSESR